MENNKPKIAPETSGKVSRKNTSVVIREDLWKQICVSAIMHGRSFSEEFEAAIEHYLGQVGSARSESAA